MTGCLASEIPTILNGGIFSTQQSHDPRMLQIKICVGLYIEIGPSFDVDP